MTDHSAPRQPATGKSAAKADAGHNPWDLSGLDRDNETRDGESRSAEMREYSPPQLLPDPQPRDGWRFKWVRTAMTGSADNMNVSMKMREGWEPVLLEDLPELNITMDVDSRWAKEGHIEVGGLMLCKMPEKVAKQRDEYFATRASDHERAVDRRFKNQSDSRMPLEVIERKSSTTMGRRDKP